LSRKWALFFLLISLGTLTHGQISPFEALRGAYERLFFHGNQWTPLLDERLPRLIILSISGASLAVAGGAMQSLFHNPLASPGLLGLSCGGSFLVTITLLAGWPLIFPLAIPLAAILGSLLTLTFVYLVAKKSQANLYSLILTGIALSTIFLAAQSTLIYWFRNEWNLMQILTEWQAGSSYNRSWTHVHMQLPLALIGFLGIFSHREELNLMALGEEEALNLGVDVPRIRWRLFLSVALLSGGTLAGIGSVTFFGLLLPQLMRTLYGPNHFVLIPACFVGGGVIMPGIDLSLRLLGIHSLTLGNVSAICGGIYFFFLLLQGQRQEQGGYAHS